MTGPRAHEMLRLVRPDEIAECWEGVPDWLYSQLWDAVRHLKPYHGETPPEPDVNSVKSVWRHLSVEAKVELNRLAAAQDAERAKLWGD